MAIGFDIWELFIIGYIEAIEESRERDTKQMDSILSGIPNYVIDKVKKCPSSKQIWDELQKFYEEKSSDCSNVNLRQKKQNIFQIQKDNLTNTKITYPPNALIVVEYNILLQNVHMRGNILMHKKNLSPWKQSQFDQEYEYNQNPDTKK